MTPDTDTICSVDGCISVAARGGMCWSHVKRRQRQRPLGEIHVRGRGRKHVLLDAIYDLLEADAGGLDAWSIERYLEAAKAAGF